MPEKSPKEYWQLERVARVAAIMRAGELRDEAARVIALWNEQLASKEPLLFSPTSHAALISNHHWLHVLCRGCDSVAKVDLRVVPRPHAMTIHEIVLKLRCQRCRGQGPVALPVKLTAGLR